MYWYLKGLRLYADFYGRARRKEFWIFTLFNIVFFWLAIFLDILFETTIDDFGIIESLYTIFMFIPQLAVSVRRLHDIGKSGWYNLIAIIPYIGWLVLIFLFCQDSQIRENRWGKNPKMKFM